MIEGSPILSAENFNYLTDFSVAKRHGMAWLRWYGDRWGPGEKLWAADSAGSSGTAYGALCGGDPADSSVQEEDRSKLSNIYIYMWLDKLTSSLA